MLTFSFFQRNVFGGYNILYREVSHFLLETLDSREEKANAEEPLVLIGK